MKETNFRAGDKKLSDVLFSSFSRYKIPRYQRPYSWTEDHVSDFWYDIDNSKKTIFLGSFIFNIKPKQKGYIEIIDGQQRLLTITILLAVLRDIGKTIDPKMGEVIQRKDISFEDRNGRISSHRIEPGDTTQIFFEKYIQSGDYSPLEIKEAEKKKMSKEELLIIKNYTFLHENIIEKINTLKTDTQKIEYLKSIRDKIEEITIIEIKVGNEDDAYETFETTNARGADLTIADLLKNLVMRNIKTDRESDWAKTSWQEICDNIAATNNELKKFIRYYWLSKHSFVSEKKLFKEIRYHIKDWKEFLKNLREASIWFNKLMVGTENDFKDLRSGIKIFKAVAALRLMNVTQCHVLFLSILRNIDKIKTKPLRVFEMVEAFTAQYSVICKQPGNKVERLYSKFARDIEGICQSGKDNTAKLQSLIEKFKKDLVEKKPTQSLFEDNFMTLSYKNSAEQRKLISYILSKINNYYSPTTELDIAFNNVNIEHIIPQKPQKTSGLTKKDIKNYVNKIGNLTLLGKEYNSSAQNDMPKKKIKYYRKSKLPITKILLRQLKANKYCWGQKNIEDRQKEFADHLYNQIWNFDKK